MATSLEWVAFVCTQVLLFVYCLVIYLDMYKTKIIKKTLHFKQPAGTSRGVYTTRDIWIVRLQSDEIPGRVGVGECAPLPDLSCDALPDYDERLRLLCDMVEQTGRIDRGLFMPYPSMLFGLEVAMLNLGKGKILFDSAFARGEEGIPINGLVWMGNYEEMNLRMEEKLKTGFKCVKLKIGAIDFDSELSLIKSIRRRFSKDDIELRVDANGGFSVEEAPNRLEALSHYDIHSIEQPIKQGQWKEMAVLCRNTPLPIALDEELIGVNMKGMKQELLDRIKPHYLVLKPSLHGGICGTEEWVTMARECGVGSWITSALESNVGLGAIAQLAAHVYGDGIDFAQGLGTGALFTDNTDSTTEIRGNELWMKG